MNTTSLVLDRVSYSYPGSRVAALNDVSCSILAGRTVGVLGANGSGKSTLALVLAGLLQPGSGNVFFNSPGGREKSPPTGLLLQNPDNNLIGATVAEDVAFGPVNMGLAPEDVATRVADAMQAVGVTVLAGRDPASLSEGEKQLVALTGLIAMRPSFLLLDEPTSALDHESSERVARAVRRLARQYRMGVVLISQAFEEVLEADVVLVLHEGSVEFAGSVAEALAESELLRSLGVEPPALSFIWRQLQIAGREPASALAYSHEGAVEELCRRLS